MGAMDVAVMDITIVPIFELLEWGRGGLRHALGRMIATTTVEGHAASLIVSPTAESVSTAAVVGARTTTTGFSLLALVLLLATLATARLTILVVFLWVLKHAGRGLVADGIAKHLDLPLHSFDGGIVVA